MSLLRDCKKMSPYLFEQWKCARWRRGDRFYRCEVRQDLFGNWVVVRQWGGVSSGKWGAKEMVCKSYAEAEALFAAVAKRREKRKYFPLVVE
jgi:hypothetical protein